MWQSPQVLVENCLSKDPDSPHLRMDGRQAVLVEVATEGGEVPWVVRVLDWVGVLVVIGEVARTLTLVVPEAVDEEVPEEGEVILEAVKGEFLRQGEIRLLTRVEGDDGVIGIVVGGRTGPCRVLAVHPEERGTTEGVCFVSHVTRILKLCLLI